MKCLTKTVETVFIGVFVWASVLLTTAECKTVSSRVPQATSKLLSAGTDSSSSNVFYSVAKSLATEALSQFKETARRNPRLGFNITMLLPQSLTNLTNGTTTTPQIGNLLDTTTQLGIIGVSLY